MMIRMIMPAIAGTKYVSATDETGAAVGVGDAAAEAA